MVFSEFFSPRFPQFQCDSGRKTMLPDQLMIVINVLFFFLCCFYIDSSSSNETSSKLQQCRRSVTKNCSPATIWKHGVDRRKDVRESYHTKTTDYASKVINKLSSKIKETENSLANPDHYPANYSPRDEEEFDFIVVGAGTAGAVIANRLTEVPAWKVLLIEAGGNPTKSTEIPGLAVSLQLTDLDWHYKTEPEENVCLGMVNNRCNWPRGKVLGGSSTTNYMMYVRGNSKDYNNWAAAGNTGWSYEDVLPYFKKSEDMRLQKVWSSEDADKYHGKGGYLKVEPWSYSDTDPLMEKFGKGLKAMGYHFNLDYNGRNQTGFIRFHGTLEDHKRCSSAKAFLTPIKDRSNLKVAKHSLVTKILFDEDTNTAVGVELLRDNGKFVRVLSKKEVVLSAGAINSPHLLMLSGIGPKQHLMNFNLPVVSDLLVGENLQDHPLMASVVISVNYSVSSLKHEQSMLELLTSGSGGLTNMRASTYSAFINTVSGVTDYPDIQFLHFHALRNDSKAIRNFLRSFGMREKVIKSYVKINEYGDSVFLLGSLIRPFSRGRIQLKSPNFEDHPKILSGSLSDKKDVETFLRNFDFIERLVKTEELKSVDARLHEVRLAECENYSFPSREYRECSLRHLTLTTYHYSGTCKMGPASDPAAVVDPSLRVFGVKRLRVADASIIPTIVSGNINAAVVMIGEKASDLIKQAWL